MKNLAFALILLSLVPNAFARHAYRSETCKSKTHRFTYDGNYPVGGYYSIGKNSDVNRENRVELVEANSEEYSEEEIKGMGNFEIKKTRKTWFNKSTDDGCFETNTYRNTKTLKFTNLKETEEATLDIKNGDEIKFSCVETYSVPSGDDC